MITSDNPKVRKGMDLVDDMTPEELDQLVDYIRVVFKTKREQANARAQAMLQVGDRVKITGNIKPQYLIGLMGIVEEKKNTRVLIKLDRGPIKKFRSGKVLSTPSALTRIED